MTRRRVVVLRDEVGSGRGQVVARWLRTLLPVAVLVVTPLDAAWADADLCEDDAVTVSVDELESGPLAMADTVARKIGATPRSADVGHAPGRR